MLDLIDKEFKKKFNISSTIALDVEITEEYLLNLKKFYQFYLLCLIEICNKLNDIGLGVLGLTLIQIFQTFKANMAFFLKFNIFFFKMKNLYKEAKAEPSPESIIFLLAMFLSLYVYIKVNFYVVLVYK